MKLFPPSTLRAAAASLGLALALSSVEAAENPPAALSASDVAARLSAMQEDGSSFVRLKMEVRGAAKTSLQLQIKERRTSRGADVVYQVLWPKERKGESVLLRKAGGRAANGTLFVPPNTVSSLDAARMSDSLFGGNLCYEDVVENFFAWDQQALVGNEAVGGTNCAILESKPGKGGRSIYGSVRTWVDLRRMVPLRVEKYTPSGQLVRRIETTRVANDDKGRPIPANLTVSSPKQETVTDMDGSRIKHNVTFTDRDFTAEGMKDLTPPTSAGD